jgi:hypothetical protein
MSSFGATALRAASRLATRSARAGPSTPLVHLARPLLRASALTKPLSIPRSLGAAQRQSRSSLPCDRYTFQAPCYARKLIRRVRILLEPHLVS